MRLYLAQHGLAVDKTIDPERPLSDIGRHQVTQVATRLKGMGIRPGKTMHSGKRRAEQTAEILIEALDCDQATRLDCIKPNDPPAEIADIIADWQADALIVGHLPFMQRLAALLLSGDPEAVSLAYLPGSIACLERTEDGWRLDWFLRPDSV